MRWPIADRPGSYPLRAHGRRLVAGERKGRGRLCHYVVRRGFGSPVTLPEDECANAIGRSYHASYPLDQPPNVTGLSQSSVGAPGAIVARIIRPHQTESSFR